MWGKFSQKNKFTRREYVDDIKTFYEIVLNKNIENLSVAIIDDNLIYVTYEEKDESIKPSFNTNIYVGCFTTSNARLRLYEMLDKLNQHVCYCDTDSIVYIENETTKKIVEPYLGDSLGQWTDELNGGHITYWNCAQPKDYGYILDNGDVKGKCKGFRVSAETEEKMTFEERTKLIKGQTNTVNINYDQFVIQKDLQNIDWHAGVITKSMTKQWNFKFDKRIVVQIDDDYVDSLPYGF